MPRRLARTLAAALVAVACLAPAACSDGGDEALSALESAIRLMELPLDDFVAEALADDHDGRLEWSSDLCSGPAVFSIWVDEFSPACRRHDFGYRNFGADVALDKSEERRAYVDAIFAADLAAICDAQPPGPRLSCAADAEVFHAAVRVTPFGQSAFFD